MLIRRRLTFPAIILVLLSLLPWLALGAAICSGVVALVRDPLR